MNNDRQYCLASSLHPNMADAIAVNPRISGILAYKGVLFQTGRIFERGTCLIFLDITMERTMMASGCYHRRRNHGEHGARARTFH